MEYICNAIKPEEVKLANLKRDIWKLWILTQNWAELVSKMQCAPIFMEPGTYCKSNILILYIIVETDDLDPKLEIRANLVPTLKFAPIFMKFGTHNKWNILIMNITLAMVWSIRVIIDSECL